MRHALRRRYRRLFGRRAPVVGRYRIYRKWKITALRGGEFSISDPRGRHRGLAMTWEAARDVVDDLQDESYGHSHEPGTRDSEEMVRAATAPTIVPPPETRTMRGQIEYDKRLKAARERKKR